MGRTGASISVGVVLTLVCAAGPAAAAPGSGAVVRSEPECYELIGGDGNHYRGCWTGRMITRSRTTPSGNVIAGVHGDVHEVLYINGVLAETHDSKVNGQMLVRNGEGQVYRARNVGGYTDRHGVTCSFVYHFHVANSEVQFSRTELACTPSATT